MLGGIPQRDGNDDRVIDETQHGNEVRDQVNWREQIGEEDEQPNSGASRYRSIGAEPFNQPDDVWR